MLAGHEGGHIVHGELVHQRLVMLGVVPFVVDQGEVLSLADDALHPLADSGERVGKPPGIHRIAFIDVRIQGNLPVPGHPQSQAELAQIEPFLLRVAPLGSRGALIATRQVGEKVTFHRI